MERENASGTGMIALLERVLKRGVGTVRFSEVAPLPPGAWDNARNFGCVRFSLPLEGGHTLYMNHGGSWGVFRCPVGEALVFVPLSWTANAPSRTPEWCENLGIVLHHDRLSLIHTVSIPLPDGTRGRNVRRFRIRHTLRRSTAALLRTIAEFTEGEEYAAELLMVALRMLRDDLAAAGNNSPRVSLPLWNGICEYLSNHYMEQIDRQHVAEEFGISVVYLSKLFAKYGSGDSFNRTLNRIRLQNAALQLRQEVASAADIARKCGFPDASYFGTRFKRFFGCSPAEYRKKHIDNGGRGR